MLGELLRSVRVQNFLLLLLGTFFVFFRIGHEPLWLDESYSALMNAHSFRDIWRYTQTDVHPPLYYIVLHLFTQIGGTSEFVYRLPSALFALGLVFLGIGPVARLYGRPAGVIFSLLVITAPSIVSFAQEARMYTMMAFAVTGFFTYGLLAVEGGRKQDFVASLIFYITAMYTHYFALLAAAIFGIGLLGYVYVINSPYKKIVWACLALACIAYIPWLASFWHQLTRVAAGFWIPPADGFILKFAWMMPFAYKFEDIPWHPWGYVSMGISLGVIGYCQYKIFVSRQRRFLQMMPMSLYLATFVVGIILSWTVEPVLMPRYMLFGVPLFFLALAMGIARMASPAIRSIVTVSIIALMMPANFIIYQHNFNGAFWEMATMIEQDPHAPIVHEDWQTLLPLGHRLPERTHLFFGAPQDAPVFDDFYGKNPPIAVHSLKDAFSYGQNVFFVDSNLISLIDSEILPQNKIHPVTATKFNRPYAFIHPTVTYAAMRE